MVSTLISLPILTFLLLLAYVDAQTNECINFNQTCHALNGVIDGGRCFFLPNGNATWANAWQACQQYGAVLAQIQTNCELNAILAKLGISPSQYIWIALQRAAGTEDPAHCAVTTNTTYWYDNATSPNYQLVANNTWVRYHRCGENDTIPGEYCMFINIGLGNPIDTMFIGDLPCGNSESFLCQLTDPNQNFTKTNVCLTETPIEILSAATEPYICALECSKKTWCRNFNFIHDSITCENTCQLFSWSVYDACPNCAQSISAVGTNCYNFNYDPSSSSCAATFVTQAPTVPSSLSPSHNALSSTSTMPPCPSLTSTPTLISSITAVGQINACECLTSPNRVYTACMQTDGNFVVSNGTNQLWSTNISCSSGSSFFIKMQNDNNLVIYSATMTHYWSSQTCYKGLAPATMTMQNNGNFVVTDANNTILWSWQNGLVGSACY